MLSILCVSFHQGQKDMGEVGRANAGGQVVSRNHWTPILKISCPHQLKFTPTLSRKEKKRKFPSAAFETSFVSWVLSTRSSVYRAETAPYFWRIYASIPDCQLECQNSIWPQQYLRANNNNCLGISHDIVSLIRLSWVVEQSILQLGIMCNSFLSLFL